MRPENVPSDLRPGPPAGPQVLDPLLDWVRGVVEEIFGRLDRVVGAVVEARAQAGASGFGPRELARLKPLLTDQVGQQSGADGCGVLMAPQVVSGRERHIEWWQRGSAGLVPLRLNLDPASVDVYEYVEMDWFTAARDQRRRSAFGPYVDYSGADRYIVTFTAPVADEVFLGVAGMDLRVAEFEQLLLEGLRGCGYEAVLVGPERRVIVANSPRWLVGSRLPRPPAAGEGPFVAVGDVGLGSGWSVALAAEG